jgi:hypothetical protein
LFIVFYGKYDNSFFEVLQNRFSKSKIKNKENIRFLDIIDFANLFSLDDNEMTELSHLNKLIIDTVNTKKEMRLEALKVLEDYSSDAM